MTPDPYAGSASVFTSQSWNRYSYVENDPVNKVDPEGLDPVSFPHLMHPGEAGGGGWWGPWKVDVWGLPWWMPFPGPRPVEPLPPAPEVPALEPSAPPASPISNPFGLTAVQVIPCPVADPRLCVAIKIATYVAAAVALLVETIRQADEQDTIARDSEAQMALHESVCRGLPNRNAHDRKVRARCWSSVQERYAACIRRQPLPPLVTW